MGCSLTWCVFAVVCTAVTGGHLQVFCELCKRPRSKDGHKLCTSCRRKQRQHEEQENIDPLAQIGENATQLMASLPTHSHHRAPLLQALSQHLPSTVAAPLLHSTPSYIRVVKSIAGVKRKFFSDSDLVQQKYAVGVKRQRLQPERVEQLCDFVAATCPTKSGERSVTYHQYTTDDSLYSAYCQSASAPVSFNTFYRIKKWMRVRRAGKYLVSVAQHSFIVVSKKNIVILVSKQIIELFLFIRLVDWQGQFDCSKCITFNKLQHKAEADLTGEEAQEMRRCTQHRTTKNFNASTISRCGLSSNRVSCSC